MTTTTSLPALPKIRSPEQWAQWLEDSKLPLLNSDEEAEIMAIAIEGASIPARPDEVAAEAMVIIAQHFVGDQGRYVAMRTSELWLEHLAPYPLWAIKRAVSWWVGKDNPKRDKRAQPGDIAERCEIEVSAIVVGRSRMRWWNQYRGAYPSFLTQKRTG